MHIFQLPSFYLSFYKEFIWNNQIDFICEKKQQQQQQVHQEVLFCHVFYLDIKKKFKVYKCWLSLNGIWFTLNSTLQKKKKSIGIDKINHIDKNKI